MTNTFDEELFELDDEDTPRGRLDGDEDDDEFEDFGDEVPRGRLAQTGMLWWPVMALALAGFVLCLSGFLVFRRNDDD